jgi:hypothetical protein
LSEEKKDWHSNMKDWRIGLSAKPKFRGHHYYYERGEILDVLPSGTNGVVDADGVLKIRLAGGSVVLEGANQWVTA